MAFGLFKSSEVKELERKKGVAEANLDMYHSRLIAYRTRHNMLDRSIEKIRNEIRTGKAGSFERSSKILEEYKKEFNDMPAIIKATEMEIEKTKARIKELDELIKCPPQKQEKK